MYFIENSGFELFKHTKSVFDHIITNVSTMSFTYFLMKIIIPSFN